MPADSECRTFDEVSAELALGVATGEQRAAALAHAADCDRCRRRLAELSTAVDGLLLLAPEREPPVGFESALQARLEGSGTVGERGGSRRVGRLRVALPALAAVAAIVLLGVSWIGTSDDRRLAADYRAALGAVDGSYFTTFAVTGPESQRLGNGFAYEGDPSWVFVTFDAPAETLPAGRYRLGLRLDGGPAPTPVPIALDRGTGSGGISFPGELDRLEGLTLTGPDGKVPLRADSTRTIYP